VFICGWEPTRVQHLLLWRTCPYTPLAIACVDHIVNFVGVEYNKARMDGSGLRAPLPWTMAELDSQTQGLEGGGLKV
jgi:hypothetical protein